MYFVKSQIAMSGTEMLLVPGLFRRPLLAMKEGLVQYEHLINIKGVKGLNEVSAQNGTIKIGALCTHHQLERSAILRNQLPTLVKLEQNVANVRVRHAGTIGGNLCFAEPHADPGTLLLALNATMVVEKSSSKRKIPAAECFVDAYETSLATDELLTEIRIPTPAAETRSAYVKFGYLERPSVGVALVFGLHNNLVNDVKIAVACAGPAPRRIEEAEALLNCKSASEAQQNLAEAGTIAGRASQAISDLHGSQEYKEHIVRVLLKRAFESILN